MTVDPKVLLQHRRRKQWRTLLDAPLTEMQALTLIVQAAQAVAPTVQWRISDQTGREVMTWTGDRWVAEDLTD